MCCLLLHAEQRAGYRVDRVHVPVAHGDTVAGYLLVPDIRPEQGLPAIVAMHDHGAWFTIGKEKVVWPMDARKQTEAMRWVEKCYEGQFVADTLASRGYVVLVIDALYWGERNPFMLYGELAMDSLKRLNKRLKNEQEWFYGRYMEMAEEAWFERILADDKASVDYLMTLPYVDTTRIGVWGFSMGAYRAWQLAAEDRRVAWCAAANWMQGMPPTDSLTERSWQLQNVSSWSMYRPSKDRVSYGEIVSGIAPRPMLLQYGSHDKLFPYGEHGIRPWPKLQIEVLEAKHCFTRGHLRNLIRFLDTQI